MSAKAAQRSMFLPVLAVVLAVLPVAASSAAPDRKAPRIVAAVVLDANGDFRADRVRVTFSERVRHSPDVDGKYPFVVAGYRIGSVAAASGRSVVIRLVERSSVDGAVRPAVRYRRTGSKPVRDRAGNQARAQVFRARAHGRVPTAPPPSGPPPLPPAPNLDPDGDGFPAPADCQPTNAAVNPRAADLPDLAFVDSNCDGIDGTEVDALFVSPLGNDANAGTKAAPKREIGAAIAVAGATKPPRYVLAAAGTYGRVVVASDVSIYGGYDPTTWARANDTTTTITGSPEAILAPAATGVVLQRLSVQGFAFFAGGSAYGIRAIDGSSLTLQRVIVTAGPANVGLSGQNGKAGAAGANGGIWQSNGGVGGSNATIGLNGGHGGEGGGFDVDDRNGEDGLAGQGGTPGGKGGFGGPNGGRPGANGQNGRDGIAGSRGSGGSRSTSQTASVWIGNGGSSGSLGAFGHGGGGGGGGNSGKFPYDFGLGKGGGAGGGGAGGIFGGRGEGGGAGGGSFGVYLYNSTLVAESCTIASGNGGAGGKGGDGGSGGAGGLGGLGYAKPRNGAGKGGTGGRGGNGGQGGGGGGGAGGPSIAVIKVGSAATLLATQVVIGQGGPGGAAGSGGAGTPAASEPGIAQAIYP